jgi:hypothetical protein
MQPTPQQEFYGRRGTHAKIDARKEWPNDRLMKQIGSKDGYVPLPNSHYKWQGVQGESPLYRVWSWMVSATLAFGRESPYAVRPDGTPATLGDCAKALGLDKGHVSNLWKEGVAKTFWYRKNGRELWLNGDVKAEQVLQANNRRKVECTLNLSPRDLKIINSWNGTQRAQFNSVWEAARRYQTERAKVARALLLREHSELDDSIRKAFGLPQIARDNHDQLPLVELPAEVAAFVLSVQTTPTHSTSGESTHGEETGENVSVQEPHPLVQLNSCSFLIPSSANSAIELETDRLVEALRIDAAAAFQLLTETRKIEPTITWREVLELARIKLRQVKPKISVAGLLLTAVPGMAKGAMLELARAEVRGDQEREKMEEVARARAEEARRREAQAILDDPDATENELALARSILNLQNSSGSGS